MFFRAWAFSSGDIFFASSINSSKNCCLVTHCGSGFMSFKGTSHTVNYMLNSAVITSWSAIFQFHRERDCAMPSNSLKTSARN